MDETIELTMAKRMARRGLPGGRLLQGAFCPYGQNMPPINWRQR